MSNRIVSMNSVINATKTNLFNTYTPGSGVGANSISNRRAKLARANLNKGTMENPKTGKCNGFCVNGSLPHPSGHRTHSYLASPQPPGNERFYLYFTALASTSLDYSNRLNYNTTVNNKNSEIKNIYNTYNFNSVNSFSQSEIDNIISFTKKSVTASQPLTQEEISKLEKSTGVYTYPQWPSIYQNIKYIENVANDIYNIWDSGFTNDPNFTPNKSLNAVMIGLSSTTNITRDILLDLNNTVTQEIINSSLQQISKQENFYSYNPNLTASKNLKNYLLSSTGFQTQFGYYSVAIFNIFNMNYKKNLDNNNANTTSVIYWLNPYNSDKILSTLGNIENRDELFNAITYASIIDYVQTSSQNTIIYKEPWHPIYGGPNEWSIEDTIKDMSYMFASLPDIRIIYNFFLENSYWNQTTRPIDQLSVIIEPNTFKLNKLYKNLQQIVKQESQRQFQDFNLDAFNYLTNISSWNAMSYDQYIPNNVLNYNNSYVLGIINTLTYNSIGIIGIIVESNIIQKYKYILNNKYIVTKTNNVFIKTIDAIDIDNGNYTIDTNSNSINKIDCYIPNSLYNLYNITESGNTLPIVDLDNYGLSNFFNPFYRIGGEGDTNNFLTYWNNVISASEDLFKDLDNYTSRFVNLDIISYFANNINPPLLSSLGNVTNMNNMFSNLTLSSLNNLDGHNLININNTFDNWNVQNVTNMSNMFSGCRNFDSDLSEWQVQNVTDMNGMFIDCQNLTSDLSIWQVQNVTNMSNMFYNCINFDSDLSNWQVQNVTDMNSMFGNCQNFTSDLSNWQVQNVTDMNSMFYYCQNFTSDLSNWQVQNVTSMKEMFNSCQKFTSDLSNWQIQNVTNMNGMFYDCQNFTSDLSNWQVQNVTDMNSMFVDCKKFTSDLSNWQVQNVTSMSSMFTNCKKFDSDLSNWQVQNVTDMNSMFSGCTKFDSDLSNWQVQNVTDMSSMFVGCTKFNRDLSSWQVQNVKNMFSMFADCTNFTSDLSNWQVQNVTNMFSMFYGCGNFTSHLSNWQVQNVTEMNNMFAGCTLLLDTYPNLPTSPSPQDWTSSTSNYWYREPSEHTVNIGNINSNNISYIDYNNQYHSIGNVQYKGFWKNENIIYTYYNFARFNTPYNIQPGYSLGSLSPTNFGQYEILGAFLDTNIYPDPNTYYIFYSTNVVGDYNNENVSNSITNLINNLLYANNIEVSIENSNYTDNIINPNWTEPLQVTNEYGNQFTDQPWVAVIGYELNTNSDFFKIVNGDYGSPYTLKITQTSDYP